MSEDFEVHPVGTARRLHQLEAQLRQQVDERDDPVPLDGPDQNQPIEENVNG